MTEQTYCDGCGENSASLRIDKDKVLCSECAYMNEKRKMIEKLYTATYMYRESGGDLICKELSFMATSKTAAIKKGREEARRREWRFIEVIEVE